MYRMIVAAKVRRIWRQVDSGDRSAPVRAAHPHLRFRFAGDSELATELDDRDDFAAWFDRVFDTFPGLRFDVEDVVVAGWPWRTRVAVRLAITAVLADGTAYRNVASQWLILRWGTMTDDWVLEDTALLNAALAVQRHAGRTT